MSLRNMTPSLAANNHTNGAPAYAVFGGKLLVVCAMLLMKFSDLRDRLLRELGLAVVRALCLPSLLNHVRYVVGIAAEKQMGRIDAKSIVATMTHMQIVGKFTKMDLIGHAVRAGCLAFVARFAVPSVIREASPFPAFINAAFVYLAPKELIDGCATVMPVNKPGGLPFNMSRSLMIVLRDWGWLSATTFAQLWGVVRGMIGVHENLHFSATPPNDLTRCGGNFMRPTRVIIAQGGA